MLQYYAPDYELDVRPSNMDNANSPEYLEKIKVQVIENLKRTTFAPSVQMTEVPRDPEGMDDEAEHMLDDLDEDENKDKRYTKRRWGKYIEKEGELSDSEDEEENERNGVRRQPGASKRRNMMDFQNADAVIDDEDPGSGANSSPRGRSQEQDDLDAPPEADDNASAHSSTAILDDSGVSTEGGSVGSSPPVGDLNDEDVDMADDSPILPTAPTQLPPDRPQEATPPDSPPAMVTAPPPPAQPIEQPSTDAMEEDETLDEPPPEQDDDLEVNDANNEQLTEPTERP